MSDFSVFDEALLEMQNAYEIVDLNDYGSHDLDDAGQLRLRVRNPKLYIEVGENILQLSTIGLDTHSGESQTFAEAIQQMPIDQANFSQYGAVILTNLLPDKPGASIMVSDSSRSFSARLDRRLTWEEQEKAAGTVIGRTTTPELELGTGVLDEHAVLNLNSAGGGSSELTFMSLDPAAKTKVYLMEGAGVHRSARELRFDVKTDPDNPRTVTKPEVERRWFR